MNEPTPIEQERSGVGGFYLDLGRLIRSLPPDVNKKLSLHDLKRVCDNYNTIPCPNCYGGHFRPCQWCGDTGLVVFIPSGAERWANGDTGESESGAVTEAWRQYCASPRLRTMNHEKTTQEKMI